MTIQGDIKYNVCGAKAKAFYIGVNHIALSQNSHIPMTEIASVTLYSTSKNLFNCSIELKKGQKIMLSNKRSKNMLVTHSQNEQYTECVKLLHKQLSKYSSIEFNYNLPLFHRILLISLVAICLYFAYAILIVAPTPDFFMKQASSLGLILLSAIIIRFLYKNRKVNYSPNNIPSNLLPESGSES